MNSIRLGVALPSHGSLANTDNIVQVSKWADELGYSSAWASDHVVIPRVIRSRYPGARTGRFPHGPEYPWLDALTVLTWVDASVPTLSVGTSVLILPLRNPFVLAKQIATLASLSKGRFILGVGAGWMEEEFAVLGADFPGRVEATVTSVESMRRLWAGDLLSDAGIGSILTHPPKVVWGGYTQSMLRIIARHGDGWIGAGDPGWFAKHAAYLQAECERIGRNPGSLHLIAKPSNTVTLTRELFDYLIESGATEVIIDPPYNDGFEASLEVLAEAARVNRLPRQA